MSDVRMIASKRMPWVVLVPPERYDPVVLAGDHPSDWCEEQFGRNSVEYPGSFAGMPYGRIVEPMRWTHVYNRFFFAHHEDAIAFKLRWF